MGSIAIRYTRMGRITSMINLKQQQHCYLPVHTQDRRMAACSFTPPLCNTRRGFFKSPPKRLSSGTIQHTIQHSSKNMIFSWRCPPSRRAPLPLPCATNQCPDAVGHAHDSLMVKIWVSAVAGRLYEITVKIEGLYRDINAGHYVCTVSTSVPFCASPFDTRACLLCQALNWEQHDRTRSFYCPRFVMHCCMQ